MCLLEENEGHHCNYRSKMNNDKHSVCAANKFDLISCACHLILLILGKTQSVR